MVYKLGICFFVVFELFFFIIDLCIIYVLFLLEIIGFEIVVDFGGLGDNCGFVCIWFKGFEIDG